MCISGTAFLPKPRFSMSRRETSLGLRQMLDYTREALTMAAWPSKSSICSEKKF